MPTEIDSLSLAVKSNADSAVNGINALAESLKNVKSALGKGLGLSSFTTEIAGLGGHATKLSALADSLEKLGTLNSPKLGNLGKQIDNIGAAAARIDGSFQQKINTFVGGLQSIAGVGNGVKISSTIGKNLQSISTAINSLQYATIPQDLIDGLSRLGTSRVSATVGKNLTDLGSVAEQLNGKDFSGIQNLGQALSSLNAVERNNLGSIFNQLARLPEIQNAVASVDMDAFTSDIQRLTQALAPLATQLNSVQDGLRGLATQLNNTSTNVARSASTTTSAGRNYANLAIQVMAAYRAVKMLANSIAGWINKANKYIEDLNLFNASMGEFASSAQNYAEQVGEVMGIDPGAWMRSQGVFMTLATGFGVAADRAAFMSQNLVQLGYDLSSFFNIDVADSMQKLQSGIAGELEPLRRLGYDLSQARLQAVAASLGITKLFTSMTQAEKAQLRYYAIMTQVTTAQGDMARTLSAPANQMRVLKAQIEQVARALGNVFIPALNAVLPYAIALANAIRMVVSSLASFFGFALPEVDYSGLSGAAGAAEDLGSALGGASGSAKELKGLLADFDELNIIQSDSGGGGGGGGRGSGTGGFGSGWEFGLPGYDFLQGLVKTKVDDILRQWKPQIDWVREHLEGILSLVEAVGAALVLWNTGKNFLPELRTGLSLLNQIKAVTLSAITIGVSVALSYTFAKKFVESGDVLNLIAEELSTALGGLIAAAEISKAFKSTSAGFVTAGITFELSAAVGVLATYNGLKIKGFSGQALGQAIVSAINSAIGTGLIAYGITGSASAALASSGIGLLVAAGVVLTIGGIALYQYNQEQLKAKVDWGSVELTSDEIKKFCEEKLFNIDVTATISITRTNIDTWAEAKRELISKATEFNSGLNLIKLGVNSADTYSDMLNYLTGGATDGTYTDTSLLGQIAGLMTASYDLIKIGVSIVPPADVEGQLMDVATVLQAAADSDSATKAVAESLGKDLGELLVKGMNSELDSSQQAEVIRLSNWISEITRAATEGFYGGEFLGATQIALTDLTRESLSDVLVEFANREAELKESLTTTALEYKGALGSKYAQAYAAQTAAEALYGTKSDLYIAAKQAADEARDAFEKYNPMESVSLAMDTYTTQGRADLIDTISKLYSGEDIENAIMRSLNESDIEAMWGEYFRDADVEYLKDEWADILENTLSKALTVEDWQALQKAADALGVGFLDLLPDAIKDGLAQKITEILGESNLPNKEDLEPLKLLGLTASDALSGGMESGSGTVAAAGVSLAKSGAEAFYNGVDWYGIGQSAGYQMLNGFSSALPAGFLKIPAVGRGPLKNGAFSLYSDGGFPNTGEMFIAQENGPELIGNIGRRTAVANQGQIISGISSGVAAATASQNELLREQNRYLRIIAEKSANVTLAPSAAFGRLVKQSEAMRARNEGY